MILKIISGIISLLTYFYCFATNYQKITKGINPLETTGIERKYPTLTSLTPFTHPFYLIIIYTLCGVYSYEYFELISGVGVLCISGVFFKKRYYWSVSFPGHYWQYWLFISLPFILGIFLIYSFFFEFNFSQFIFKFSLPLFWGILQFLFGLGMLLFGLFNLFHWFRFLIQGHFKQEQEKERLSPFQWILISFFCVVLGLYSLLNNDFFKILN
tara:strand:+ start:1634 stop:2272 length:639 start_codon:yes stop_codon:yes gene_type:complete